ncbi:hypothetical protein NPIL_198251 [Nephila pilipes]|uniref:Uncharacterized protein n=1 Tax=Nephila pilipes TaxID=299642 RepID=A0A8X6U3A6_NEPPI|nr:hypothetical protein NPIL_198251 [Nephila pilipes]
MPVNIPTLQKMTLFKIAYTVVNDSEVQEMIKRFGLMFCVVAPNKKLVEIYRYLHSLRNKVKVPAWLQVGNPESRAARILLLPCNPTVKWGRLIERKVSVFSLSVNMKRDLLSLIRKICLEINRWNEEHLKTAKYLVEAPSSFVWTPQGTIDKQKTSMALMKNRRLPSVKRRPLRF